MVNILANPYRDGQPDHLNHAKSGIFPQFLKFLCFSLDSLLISQPYVNDPDHESDIQVDHLNHWLKEESWTL